MPRQHTTPARFPLSQAGNKALAKLATEATTSFFGADKPASPPPGHQLALGPVMAHILVLQPFPDTTGDTERALRFAIWSRAARIVAEKVRAGLIITTPLALTRADLGLIAHATPVHALATMLGQLLSHRGAADDITAVLTGQAIAALRPSAFGSDIATLNGLDEVASYFTGRLHAMASHRLMARGGVVLDPDETAGGLGSWPPAAHRVPNYWAANVDKAAYMRVISDAGQAQADVLMPGFSRGIGLALNAAEFSVLRHGREQQQANRVPVEADMARYDQALAILGSSDIYEPGE